MSSSSARVRKKIKRIKFEHLILGSIIALPKYEIKKLGLRTGFDPFN
jgi:hypothetical protein